MGKKETCHCLQARQEDAIYCGHTGCTGKGQRIHRTPDQEMSSVSGEGHEKEGHEKGSKGLKLASRRSTLESKRLSQSNRGGETPGSVKEQGFCCLIFSPTHLSLNL